MDVVERCQTQFGNQCASSTKSTSQRSVQNSIFPANSCERLISFRCYDFTQANLLARINKSMLASLSQRDESDRRRDPFRRGKCLATKSRRIATRHLVKACRRKTRTNAKISRSIHPVRLGSSPIAQVLQTGKGTHIQSDFQSIGSHAAFARSYTHGLRAEQSYAFTLDEMYRERGKSVNQKWLRVFSRQSMNPPE